MTRIEEPDTPLPQLSPMATPKERAEFVRRLKSRIAAGDYQVEADDVAVMILVENLEFRHSK